MDAMKSLTIRVGQQKYSFLIGGKHMKTQGKRIITAAAAFLALVLIDQITKQAAARALEGGRHIELIRGVLEFYYIQNRGAAFGIFQDGTFILSIISAVCMIALIIAYCKVPGNSKFLPLRVVLVFIAAGAAGNLIDRVYLHYVRDFIYFSLIDFPVFNVADIYVTVSVFVLVFLLMFYYKDEDLKFDQKSGI